MSETKIRESVIDKLNLSEIISKTGVLEGITWRTHFADPSDPLCAKTSPLHIGSLQDFQIQLSRDEDTGDYMMQLWEINVTPQLCEEKNRYCALPQYTPLILNNVITASDLDEAKCLAVKAVLEYACRVYDAATERFNLMLHLFGDLDATLAQKVARRRKAEPVANLGLSLVTQNILAKLNIRVIGELTSRSTKELKAIKGLGDKSINEIVAKLHANKMRLTDETTPDIAAVELKKSIAAAKAAEDAAANADNAEDAAANAADTGDANAASSENGEDAVAAVEGPSGENKPE